MFLGCYFMIFAEMLIRRSVYRRCAPWHVTSPWVLFAPCVSWIYQSCSEWSVSDQRAGTRETEEMRGTERNWRSQKAVITHTSCCVDSDPVLSHTLHIIPSSLNKGSWDSTWRRSDSSSCCFTWSRRGEETLHYFNRGERGIRSSSSLMRHKWS